MSATVTPAEAARLFPRGVGDPFCPRGGVIGTTTDHRLLWHLASILSVDAPMGSRLDDVRRDLRRYLNVRCDHHWHHSPAEDDFEEFWQCLWCCDTLMQSEAPDGGEVCQPDDSLEYWPTVNGGSTPDPRTATAGNDQSRTLADDVAAGLHDSPHP